jgi:GT2 family glycosyltransferase
MSPKNNSVDIIIVNHNSTDYLLRCLKSVYHSLGLVSCKVIVQDNFSQDNVDRVNSMFPGVLLFKNNYNMGFAKAVNIALGQGAAPYVVILNPDTCVEDNFFGVATQYMDENPDVGIMGPRILNPDGSVQGSARAFPSPLTGLFGRNTFLTRWLPNNRFTRRSVVTHKSDGITPVEVDWISGACMVARREAINDVGFLDERFFLYWEDADWCKRMWDSQWKVIYYPQISVLHHVGGSSEKSRFRATVEFHKSAYRLYAKHTRGTQRFAKPLVMWLLALRLFFVLFWDGIHRWSGRTHRHTGPKK